MLRGADRELGRPAEGLPILSSTPREQVGRGEGGAKESMLRVAVRWRKRAGERREAHLPQTTLCQQEQTALDSTALICPKFCCYLHHVLLRLGLKKNPQSSCGAVKIIFICLAFKNEFASIFPWLPPTHTLSSCLSCSFREVKQSWSREHPHAALFLSPVPHPENGKCFPEAVEVRAVHTP